jgi:hypothetical protein
MITSKQQENSARRKLIRQEYILKKDRNRSISGGHLGGYMIKNFNNCVVAGADFDLTLDDVERFVEGGAK